MCEGHGGVDQCPRRTKGSHSPGSLNMCEMEKHRSDGNRTTRRRCEMMMMMKEESREDEWRQHIALLVIM